MRQVLEGDRLVSTPYVMRFREDRANEVQCKKHLSEAEVERFRDAVKEDYYFQVRWCWCAARAAGPQFSLDIESR